MTLFNHYFGKVSEGFPSFEGVKPDRWDLAMMIVYLISGVLLGLFFEKSETWMEKLSKIIPPVLSEILAGLILGCVVAYLPAVQFSGESQMAILMTDYAKYAPLAMIGIAFLKILITNMCIHMGLKGGHFFPVIFSAVCLGYGISLLVFPLDVAHATFAAAITTAATLSVSLRKPLAVTCLLFLCFPIQMGVWIFLAAILTSQVTRSKRHEKKHNNALNIVLKRTLFFETLALYFLVFFAFAFVIYRHETVFKTYGQALWYCFPSILSA